MSGGVFYTIGVGPGDPELMSVKAARLIGQAPTVAFFAKKGQRGHAYSIAQTYIAPDAELMRFDYPCTTEISFSSAQYQDAMRGLYDDAAGRIAARLSGGRDVALLCEGDPFFYGSSMYVFDRLCAAGHRVEIVPGITGMSGCWARARVPMLHGDEVMSVLPGTLPADDLARRLSGCDAAVIMKLGGNLPAVSTALRASGRADHAVYVEYGTMPSERIMPFPALTQEKAPYFSMVLVPGRWRNR